MKALVVRKGRKDTDFTELRVYDGALGFVAVDEDGAEVETLVGINEMLDGRILDTYRKEDSAFVTVALNRDMEEEEFAFTPDKGYIRGLHHIFEEVRKGKETVTVRDMERKPLFKRMRKGVKVLK